MSEYLVNVGDLVYLDTFSGLVPAKVLRIETAPEVRAYVKLTADHRAYRRGEVLDVHPNNVVARASVHTRGGHLVVRGTTRLVTPDALRQHPCEHPGGNHSDDLVSMHTGRPFPTTLCGYHAQKFMPGGAR